MTNWQLFKMGFNRLIRYIWYKDFREFLFEETYPHRKPTFRQILCRLAGHPRGTIYYTSNPSATEPDNRCRDCHEYIG